MARRKGSPLMDGEADEEEYAEYPTDNRATVEGFNFHDERIMKGKWRQEPHSDVIQKFFQLLAVCHTAIPEISEETGMISYEAESPDEAAFVVAAREIGFEFSRRTQTTITVNEPGPASGNQVERPYQILSILEFNSTRKRVSVIVRTEEGKLILLCKGADSVMFERLAKDGGEFEEKTREHTNKYADAGLRTLILAYRELDEEEYKSFNKEFTEAKNSVSADRDALVDEKDLILLGATAVDDKLQKGVPECIDKLTQAGIKIWVLTGDKMETTINIGYACRLLRHDMAQIIVTLESPAIKAIEKTGDKAAITKLAITWRRVLKSLGPWESVCEFSRLHDSGMGMIIFVPVAILSWFPTSHSSQASSHAFSSTKLSAGG